MTRTDPSVFDIPVKKMRSGYYADQYFNHTKELLESSGHLPTVKMQCFQRENSFAGGVDEAIAILKLCAGARYRWTGPTNHDYVIDPNGDVWKDDYWSGAWENLEVKALNEGDPIEPWEPVLQIVGPYNLFAHLETTILGVMARRSLVMKNVKEVVQAANGKPILFFPARHDHWVVQTGDGMAAHQAGCAAVSTDAGASWWGGKGIGTIPHALIAAYGGNTIAAAYAFDKKFGDSMDTTVLVDFDNRSVTTALQVADKLGKRLKGVRLDTGGNLVDQAILNDPNYGTYDPRGVNPQLVCTMREYLDRAGHEHVKIIVSGGFKAEKIRAFEAAGVPVDMYGVGSSLIRGSNDYTADIVEANVSPFSDIRTNQMFSVAKVGRWTRDDSRLEVVM